MKKDRVLQQASGARRAAAGSFDTEQKSGASGGGCKTHLILSRGSRCGKLMFSLANPSVSVVQTLVALLGSMFVPIRIACHMCVFDQVLGWEMLIDFLLYDLLHGHHRRSWASGSIYLSILLKRPRRAPIVGTQASPEKLSSVSTSIRIMSMSLPCCGESTNGLEA